jgi:hypothetical protein
LGRYSLNDTGPALPLVNPFKNPAVRQVGESKFGHLIPLSGGNKPHFKDESPSRSKGLIIGPSPQNRLQGNRKGRKEITSSQLIPTQSASFLFPVPM